MDPGGRPVDARDDRWQRAGGKRIHHRAHHRAPRRARCWRSSRRASSASTTRSPPNGGELLLVYPNVIAVERQLRVSPADFRLWVCLHEVTHRVQFRANPWLAEHMSQPLAVLTEESGEDVTEVIGRLGRLRPRPRATVLRPNRIRPACLACCAPFSPSRSACARPAVGARHAAGRPRRSCDGRRRARRGAVGGHHSAPVQRAAQP